MSCQETQDLLHGYVDGELDLVRTLQIEQHLHECPACARAYAQQQALRTALRAGSLYFMPPGHLRQRVRTVMQRASNMETRARAWTWRWLGLSASLAVAAIVLWSVVPILTDSASQDHLLGELVGSHVRSLMVDHLTDVSSSDSHTVKPWFEGKLNFSPQVPDLTAQGFPLGGGRLDYLANRAVAALVYQRRQHVINLFIWPAGPDVDVEETRAARQGYHLIHWQAAGMTYWVVSNLNQRELQEFIQAVRHYISAATSP